MIFASESFLARQQGGALLGGGGAPGDFFIELRTFCMGGPDGPRSQNYKKYKYIIFI